MPWREQYPDLLERIEEIERMQREDHKVLMESVVPQLRRLTEFVGDRFEALETGQRTVLEAVDGLHSGALALARQNADLAEKNLDVVPVWFTKAVTRAVGYVFGGALVAAGGWLLVHLLQHWMGG